MGLFRSLAGVIWVRFTSADLSGLLSQFIMRDIQLSQVHTVDELTCQAAVYQKDYDALKTITERRGDRLEIVKKQGVYWSCRSLMNRPVLLIGAVMFLVISMYLPTRVLFINVSGNLTVPTKKILEAADACGISFFTSRRDIRSEKIKNALLEQIPQLQWVGVNTSGCVATISVTEKSAVNENKQTDSAVGNIVASRDGVVLECTVTKGDPVCHVGQAVKAGQVLVSGYTDCGIAIKATRAEAEIYGQTLRDMEVVALGYTAQRADEIGRDTRFSIVIGKKLINLFKDSGISDTDCVKMYEEYYLTLPGGFQLPIKLVRQTRIYYGCADPDELQEGAFSWIGRFTEDYLNAQMIAGRIISRDVSVQLEDSLCRLKGRYACLEMIGQFKAEEFIQR